MSALLVTCSPFLAPWLTLIWNVLHSKAAASAADALATVSPVRLVLVPACVYRLTLASLC